MDKFYGCCEKISQSALKRDFRGLGWASGGKIEGAKPYNSGLWDGLKLNYRKKAKSKTCPAAPCLYLIFKM